MLGQIFFVALDDEFQFVQIVRPAEAVEKFRAGELRLVERVVRIARAEVKIFATALREQRHRRGHHEHAEVARVIIQVVERVVVKRERLAFDVKRRDANFFFRFQIREHEQVRDDGRGEQRVEPLEGHHVLAELDVGVGLEKLAAFRRVIELVARDELHVNARALAQDPAVLGRRLELREVHAHLTAQIKPVQIARRWQKTGVENIRRRFARFGKRPHCIRKLVVLVVGILFGEKEFHGRNQRSFICFESFGCGGQKTPRIKKLRG